MFGTNVAFGTGFVASIKEASTPKTKTTVIKGQKIKEKKGKLSKDLGKPAMKATAKELASYVKAAKTPAEKKSRVARVNLMKAHKKGLKAQGSKVPTPRATVESVIRPMPTLVVVKPKYR